MIEADFQQYYNLNVEVELENTRFSRLLRLIRNLPIESRFVQKYNELKEWDWDREVQSRILMKLDELYCAYLNAHRKKGAKKIKPEKQFQPEWIEKFKIEHRKRSRHKDWGDENIDKIRSFWRSRNPKVKFFGIDKSD